MTGLGVFLTIVAIVGLIAIKLLRNLFEGKLDKMRINAKRQIRKSDVTEDEANELIAAERFWAPAWLGKTLVGVTVLGILLASFDGMWFYAEPTFKYHIRPFWGGESVVSNYTGYAIKGYGRVNAWKIAMTVKVNKADHRGAIVDDDVTGAEDDAHISAVLPAERIVFLDQVDAMGASTVRFKLPSDENQFLELVHEYRSPGNLLNTEFIPAVQETMRATGSLMTAEKYFSGGQTEYMAEFSSQIRDGIYLVERIEERVDVVDRRSKTADASTPTQDVYDDESKVVFKVEKQLDPKTQLPLRKEQTFRRYGVTVLSARVTGMKPNEMFLTRMEDKQKASAQRAVNREQRIQEEEQKFLAIATGEREVAQEQAKAKKTQIKKTTDAETARRLVLIKANQQKEQAYIHKQTAQIQLEQAEIDSQKRERLADAEAYEKKQILEADNALKEKMGTEVAVHTVWANAMANRAVPQYVFVSGGTGDGTTVPTGSDHEMKQMMQLLTLQTAKTLGYDRTVADTPPAK